MDIDAIGRLRLCLLDESHSFENFDCGLESMNDWLKHTALNNQKRDLSRVHALVCGEGSVRGFFSLSPYTLAVEDVVKKDRGGVNQGGLHSQLLGRFATDLSVKGNGIGSLLMDLAFEKYLDLCTLTTSKFLCLHAKEDWLVGYYERFGFKCSPTAAADSPTTLMYLKSSAIQDYWNENSRPDTAEDSLSQAS
ncbi:putative GNAT family N-acyltransferase [Arthrobacter sp. 2762]